MTEKGSHPFTPRFDGTACRVVVAVVDHRPVECGKQPNEAPHDGTRCPPPDLEFPPPPCPLCGEDCGFDDGPYCEACGVYWRPDGTAGRWDEPALKVCPSTYKPFDRADLSPEHERFRHHVVHCILALDHDQRHRSDASTAWADHQEVHRDTVPA